jgi:4-alpha-glucanotransferase
MGLVNTVFAVHNHQPIGNFDSVFEEAYRLSYKPFIDVLERHPSVKFTQHWTGTLLEWLIDRHPELVERIKGLVQRGQLELLTGSYYEAILAVIPERDRIGQIKKLTRTIQTTFDCTPRGMWLAERVWEQHLVGSLARGGVEFVMVDDTHFRHAGLRDRQLLGYYTTEEEGQVIRVMPIDKMLRYTVPFRPLKETVDYLRSVASEDGHRVVINADDGEKFGVWPKTYNSVYEQGWLEQFCRMLEDESSWVKTVHLSTVVDALPPQGRIYLPSASYSEMMKWALNSDAFLDLERFERQLRDLRLLEPNAMFVRGGYWRNFLAKYPESNHMHKKMLRIARRVENAIAAGMKVPEQLMARLWAGQCNDPYWHGVFGGLYLPNLRLPVYRSLLDAESQLDRLEGRASIHVEEVDFDSDGYSEIVIESPTLDFCIAPAFGGSLLELDVKPANVNLLDIVSRREEGYHKRLREDPQLTSASGREPLEVKEKGLERHLHFDWYRHGSLIDHVLGEGTSLQSFAACNYPELGDFVNQPYAAEVTSSGNAVAVKLVREGGIWKDGRRHALLIQKELRFIKGASGYSVDYTISSRAHQPVDLWFGVEFAVGSMAGDAPDRYYDIEGRTLHDRRLRSAGEEGNVRTIRLVDEWLRLQTAISVDTPAMLWRFPLETVSLSEAGFERIYQGSILLLHWRSRLPGNGKETRIRFTQSTSTVQIPAHA